MLVPTMMTNEKGELEEFLNKSESAEFLGVSFPTFEKNFEPRLQEYKSPRRQNVRLFKKSDLEKLNVVKPVEEDK